MNPRMRVEIELDMTLNESEIGALNALAGYGVDPFIETFYEKMGRSYLEPYEKGLRSLFSKIRNTTPTPMTRIKKARKILEDSSLQIEGMK